MSRFSKLALAILLCANIFAVQSSSVCQGVLKAPLFLKLANDLVERFHQISHPSISPNIDTLALLDLVFKIQKMANLPVAEFAEWLSTHLQEFVSTNKIPETARKHYAKRLFIEIENAILQNPETLGFSKERAFELYCLSEYDAKNEDLQQDRAALQSPLFDPFRTYLQSLQNLTSEVMSSQIWEDYLADARQRTPLVSFLKFIGEKHPDISMTANSYFIRSGMSDNKWLLYPPVSIAILERDLRAPHFKRFTGRFNEIVRTSIRTEIQGLLDAGRKIDSGVQLRIVDHIHVRASDEFTQKLGISSTSSVIKNDNAEAENPLFLQLKREKKQFILMGDVAVRMGLGIPMTKSACDGVYRDPITDRLNLVEFKTGFEFLPRAIEQLENTFQYLNKKIAASEKKRTDSTVFTIFLKGPRPTNLKNAGTFTYYPNLDQFFDTRYQPPLPLQVNNTPVEIRWY